MFATLFNVQPADVPDNVQMEIIELQSNNKLKAKYNNLPLLDFYKLYVRAEDFPILRRHALKFPSLLGQHFSASYAHGSRSGDFRSPGLDIAANKNTKMFTELLMEVKQMSRDIQFLKTEITDIRYTLNIHGAGPDSQREENFPIVLPLTNEEQFDEAEAALKEETVRRKLITRLALVGGTNSDMMIRRMLSSTMTNSLASIFNWAGKGLKTAFKDILMQDCIFECSKAAVLNLGVGTLSVITERW
ncbi:hypothetical protein ABVT39_010220 [Epinephelus coioides]